MSRRDYVFVVVILTVGWAVWLQHMGIADHDDMLSNELTFARQNVSALVLHNPWPDQSPLYFLVLHAVGQISESPFCIQLFNAILLTLTLAATYALALAFAGSRVFAAAASLLGVVSPTSLWLVRNGRMYSLQALLSTLALLFLLRYLDGRRRGDLVAVAILSVVNIYVHFIGFLITALLFIPLFVDGGLAVWRQMPTDRSVRAWRPLASIGLATATVLVLVIPQVVRFTSLVGGGIPLRPELSLPGLSATFLDRVTRFWFVNADWGALRPADHVVTGVYVGSIAILSLAGTLAVRRCTGAIAGLCTLGPLVILGVAAARMNVRDRYFVWTLPLLWIATATGGCAALPRRGPTGVGADLADGVRAALALTVVAGSLWLLGHKVSEPSPQWTKLMMSVAAAYRPSMVVYMPPASTIGIPRLVAERMGLASGLKDVQVLDDSTHAQFISQVDAVREFVFLVYGQYSNTELAWRSHYLEARDYQKTVLPVWGAHAELFTRRAIGGFSATRQLAGPATPEHVVEWAVRRLRQHPHTPSGEPVLADALVARVQADGVIRESELFASQRGESGTWKLGPAEWDAVEDVGTTSGGVERHMIAAAPDEHSMLVVAFPAVRMKPALRMTYGIADSGVRFRSGANVRVMLYVNRTLKADVSCSTTPGWKELAVDTASLDGRPAEVVMLLTTANDRGWRFAFHLEPSSRASSTALDPTSHDAGAVLMTDGRTLKDAIERLEVHRLEDGRRIEARTEPHEYSALEMHEPAGADGEGAVRRQWVFGAPLWDGVGVTRQRSGGNLRDGLWAHPRNGSTLVIEARVKIGELLRGFAGLTDYSAMQASGLHVSAPVRYKILIDGAVVFEGEARRTRGWTEFAVPIRGSEGEHRLRIEISCATDKWAHFVFDLGSA